MVPLGIDYCQKLYTGGRAPEVRLKLRTTLLKAGPLQRLPVSEALQLVGYLPKI